MASSLLGSGVPKEMIERAAGEGLLAFRRTDEYLPYRPGPRSDRTLTDCQERYSRPGSGAPTGDL